MRKHETASFHEFVETQLPRLYGLARALSGNEHDAWDLTQECLLKVGARWSRVSKMADPGAYTRTVLVRLNIDRIRRVRREVLTWHLTDREPSHPRDEGIPAWLVAALTRLTPKQRTALALRYVVDLDMAQIAAELGCSVGTARSHVSRAVQRLRAYHQIEVAVET